MTAVGVLLNPIAGYGGMLALHGTDALPASRFEEAVSAGRSASRLIHAVERFQDAGAAVDLITAPGEMGDVALSRAGIAHRVSGEAAGPTTRDHTIAAARRLVAEGVDVLLFAGGDGTATDIAEAVGLDVPVIGVPSGVKMHSGVFPRSAAGAGRLLADFVRGDAPAEPAEVLDVGADDSTGVVATLLVPRSREVLQGAKAPSRRPSAAAAGRAIATSLIEGAGDDATWIIGPGATAGAVAEQLGFIPTQRGVDVRHPSGAIESDVDELRLHEIAGAAANARLVLGVVGGQGFLLGRGNQQLSGRVIDRIGTARIDVVATEDKIGGLFPPVLYVDADGADVILGYRTVRTGPRTSTVMKVERA